MQEPTDTEVKEEELKPESEETNEFKKFATSLSLNINKTLNGDGPVNVGFACFLFSASKPGEFATMLLNVPTEMADRVIKVYLSKQSQTALRKIRRKDMKRVK